MKECLAALLPKVRHVGELVLGKSMGSGGPRSLGRRHHDQPRVQRPLAASTISPRQGAGGDLHHPQTDKRAGFCNLLRSVIKQGKLGRLTNILQVIPDAMEGTTAVPSWRHAQSSRVTVTPTLTVRATCYVGWTIATSRTLCLTPLTIAATGQTVDN